MAQKDKNKNRQLLDFKLSGTSLSLQLTVQHWRSADIWCYVSPANVLIKERNFCFTSKPACNNWERSKKLQAEQLTVNLGLKMNREIMSSD